MKSKIILDKNKCQVITYNNGINGVIASCFYTKVDNKFKKQLTPFKFCRETLVYTATSHIGKVDKQRLRLFMSGTLHKAYNNTIADKIKIGANVANIVSKKFNMQPVICKNTSHEILPNTHVVEITASPKWQRSPHMLSLFLMFTKYCNSYEFKNIKTYTELCSVLDKTKYITNNLSINSKYITFFLSNYNKLFRNLPMAENYKIQSYLLHYKKSIQYEGITHLCEGFSKHKILNKRFFKLLEK